MAAGMLPLLLMAACSREVGPVQPPRPEVSIAETPAEPAQEVLRLEADGAGGIRVAGVVPTAEARAVLLAEVRRRWAGRPLRGDVEVRPGMPALWVPEATAVLQYVAEIERGGLVVRAEAGAAGGGVLTITGRVADDEALARLAADAVASVAPPFIVDTALDVGPPADSAAVAEMTDAPPVVLALDQSAEDAVAAARAALGGRAIVFSPGTAQLEAEGAQAVASLASSLERHSAIRIEVSAGAESSGSSSLDRALAHRRAAAIADALRAGGLDGGRVGVASEESSAGPVTFRLSSAATD